MWSVAVIDTADLALSPASRPIAVLLIDDDETWARTQRRLLERSNERLSVSTATSFNAARDALAATEPDCIVCDYQLGDGTGLELLAEVRATEPDVPFILVTGEGDEAVASDAISEQVTDYVRKMDLGQQPTGLVRRIETIVDADRSRRALSRERRHKEALLETVTDSSTRSELGETICQQLVDSGYACAWIAVLDDDRGVVPLSTAGDTAYLEAAITPGTRPTDSTEPTLRALDEPEPAKQQESTTVNGRCSSSTPKRWATPSRRPRGNEHSSRLRPQPSNSPSVVGATHLSALRQHCPMSRRSVQQRSFLGMTTRYSM